MTVPDCRTLAVPSENRTMSIEAEGAGSEITIVTTGDGGSPIGLLLVLTYAAGSTVVTVTGTPAERTLAIEAEDRTMIIESCKDGG